MNPITFNFTGAIQNYTVPVTGTYDLSAFGAGGGSAGGGAGGSGAQIGATFNLTAGQQLFIIVGGVGGTSTTSNGAGGGGFSEIYTRDANNNITPLLIAGGGGGASGGGLTGGNASVAAPTALGNGGQTGFGFDNRPGGNPTGAASPGGGGAGANSDGISSQNNSTPGVTGGAGGMSAANGAAGGAFTTPGGFGGGGGGGGTAGAGLGGGGGGGGSTGGDSGNAGSSNFAGSSSGGGTSYIANTGVQNFAETMSGNGTNTGNGSVRILVPAQPAQPAAPCYVTGTRIRVLRGRTVADVPVERLRVGDLAITASGKPRPIRWIGTRAYPGLSAPKHDRPVRIRAGALADGVPARDLLVSPDHCLWLDGLFVAAGHLINGTSITRGAVVRDLTYWHVELDSHDLLMAENTPAESFLAAPGVRAGFDGTALPDAVIAPVTYAPRAERHTPEMDALRERLILRAGLSVEPTRFGGIRAWLDVCDGARVAGWAVDEAHPDAPVCLDILVDGAVVALALAQDHRADLAESGLGDGRHGFDIALDAPLTRGVPHIVEVRRSADGLRVAAKAVDAAGAWTALLAA